MDSVSIDPGKVGVNQEVNATPLAVDNVDNATDSDNVGFNNIAGSTCINKLCFYCIVSVN